MKRTKSFSRMAAFVCILFGLSAALLANALPAKADSASFSLTPYAFPDLNNVDGSNNPYTDYVSGTLTLTNSAGSVYGTFQAGSPSLAGLSMSATLTMSTNAPGVDPVSITGGAPLGVDIPPDVNWLQLGSLTVSPSGVLLSHDGYLNINYEVQNINFLFPAYITGEIDPHDDNGAIALAASPLNDTGGRETMQIFPQNLDAVYGSGAWQIASAVPEPTTFALLGAGAFAFVGSACLRPRRAD